MATTIMEFSPNGEFFAFCGVDGTLRVWETASNNLKQEFVSSTHLSATCTCLKWRPTRDIAKSSKQKKRKLKSEASSNQCQADLIALGTSSGSVLLYSVLRGELQSQWDGSHTSQVNDIAWRESESLNRSLLLYTGASDSNIVEWDVGNGQRNEKLKTDGPVYSICLCSGDSLMLSASHSIKLWDLKTSALLQTFTGHAMEVFRLLLVPMIEKHKEKKFYFLSVARDDRHVQIWQFNSSAQKKSRQNALATLLLPDATVSLTIHGPLQEDGSYLFSATTVTGLLLLFKQILNGECKKPLKPQAKLQIASANTDVPRKVSVLSAKVVDNGELLISYGNPLKPTFEKIAYGGLKPDNCLLRDVPDRSLVDKVSDVTKTKTPVSSDDVKVLTPGHLVPSKPTQNVKKKRLRHTSVDMTVEERLDVMGLSEKTEKSGLQTTSSAVLLAQGLQSCDSQILNHVLQNSNSTFIRNTIRKLPIPSIIPLVDELSRRMQGHAQSSKSVTGWTKTLLMTHSSYLMTFPDLVQNLSTLYQMMDSRVTMFSRLSQLQGKLELILSQVSDQSAAESSDPIEALITLQDESSDEDMLIPENEEENLENWEDDSESEMDDDEVEKVEEEEENSKEFEEETSDEGNESDRKWLEDDCNGDEEMVDEDGG